MRRETVAVIFSGGTLLTVLIGVVQVSRLAGQKEEQLDSLREVTKQNANQISELAKVNAELNSTVAVMAASIQYGSDASRETREKLNEVEAKVQRLQIDMARQGGGGD